MHRAPSSAAGSLLRRRQLLRTTALALTLFPLGTASAQVNCFDLGAQNCSLATDQYQYFQSFA